jgi:hypothetical protein
MLTHILINSMWISTTKLLILYLLIVIDNIFIDELLVNN